MIWRTVSQAGPDRPVGSRVLPLAEIAGVRIKDSGVRRVLEFGTGPERGQVLPENKVTFGLRYFHTADMIKRYLDEKMQERA